MTYRDDFKNKYYLPKGINISKKGFKYNYSGDYYELKFPIDYYKNYATLYCKIIINNPNEILIHMLLPSNDFYPPFYNDKLNGYNEYMKQLYSVIKKKIYRLGIREKEDRWKEETFTQVFQ